MFSIMLKFELKSGQLKTLIFQAKSQCLVLCKLRPEVLSYWNLHLGIPKMEVDVDVLYLHVLLYFVSHGEMRSKYSHERLSPSPHQTVRVTHWRLLNAVRTVSWGLGSNNYKHQHRTNSTFFVTDYRKPIVSWHLLSCPTHSGLFVGSYKTEFAK